MSVHFGLYFEVHASIIQFCNQQTQTSVSDIYLPFNGNSPANEVGNIVKINQPRKKSYSWSKSAKSRLQL